MLQEEQGGPCGKRRVNREVTGQAGREAGCREWGQRMGRAFGGL